MRRKDNGVVIVVRLRFEAAGVEYERAYQELPSGVESSFGHVGNDHFREEGEGRS